MEIIAWIHPCHHAQLNLGFSTAAMRTRGGSRCILHTDMLAWYVHSMPSW